MGTRGSWGFVIDGEEKLAYNHFDSYPSGLGNDILTWLREQDIDKLKDRARSLALVDESLPPTPDQIAACKAAKVFNGGVSTGSDRDWYCLLRDAQGDPEATLRVGLMENGQAFPLDSLFCEWAYVIDLDAGMLEVYRGFQKAPHNDGRFAERYQGDDYYPVRMEAAYSLYELPESLSSLEEEVD